MSTNIAVACDYWQFKCEVGGICIDSRRVCDGVNDCEGASDERNCTGAAAPQVPNQLPGAQLPGPAETATQPSFYPDIVEETVSPPPPAEYEEEEETESGERFFTKLVNSTGYQTVRKAVAKPNFQLTETLSCCTLLADTSH